MSCRPRGLAKGSVIYLASPYSYKTGATKQANELMMEWNFQKISEVAADWMRRGYVVFCPIAHSHPIAIYGGAPQEEWEFWAHQDLAVLERCDALVQACMPLWERSQGARIERAAAEGWGMLVNYTRNYYYDIDFRLLDRGVING